MTDPNPPAVPLDGEPRGPFFNNLPGDWAQYARNAYSQCGEDGIVAEILDRIGTTNRFCWEVGAADGRWFSNTRRLIDAGWSAVLVEADDARYAQLEKINEPGRVTTVHRTVGIDPPDLLDDVLLDAGCPAAPDLGVIDVDGEDYYVFLSMCRVKPRVLVVEFDPRVDVDFTPERRTNAVGQAGLRAVCIAGQSKGYVAVAYTRVNVIFVDESLAHAACRPRGTPAEPLRLNLGGSAGPAMAGFVNVDRKDDGGGMEIYPLDFASGSADEVYASHCLEHLPHGRTVAAVLDWARVLKPGGRLRVAVPDFNWIVDAHHRGLANTPGYPVEGYLMGGQTDADDFHHAIFTERKLRSIFRAAGLRRVRPFKSEQVDCASLPVSLNLEGYKPEPLVVANVQAIMSVPRYAPTATVDCVARALRTAGNVPLRMAWGAYWSEGLTSAADAALAEMAAAGTLATGALLFIDFDSVFDHDDVRELYRLLRDHPAADAVCAVQIGRTSNAPLMVVKDADGVAQTRVAADRFDDDLLAIASGHFGLTLVRAAALDKLARPWFQAIPDADGRWCGEGYVSADVNFWQQFAAQGFKLFSANAVPIGHLQEMILWPDRELAAVVQETGDYRRGGPPYESWR